MNGAELGTCLDTVPVSPAGGSSPGRRLPVGLAKPMALSELGKMRPMVGIERVTKPLLDVLEAFLEATEDNHRELHGWAIMKAVARSGPTVYGVIDRLEDAGWIEGRWEERNPQPNKPRRRLYHLTPDGLESARGLLAQRRPKTTPDVRRRLGEAMGWFRGLRTGWVR